MDFLCSVMLVKTYRGESVVICEEPERELKLKPQSSKVFEIHIQVFSWLNYSQILELCNFYFSLLSSLRPVSLCLRILTCDLGKAAIPV